MAGSDSEAKPSDSVVVRFWQRIPIVIRAILVGLIVFEIGSVAGIGSGQLIPAPWSIIVIGGVLWLYWKYFSGSWWPKATVETRRNRFRALRLSGAVWKWGLMAAMLCKWQPKLIPPSH